MASRELEAPEWNQQVVKESFNRSCRKELRPGGTDSKRETWQTSKTQLETQSNGKTSFTITKPIEIHLKRNIGNLEQEHRIMKKQQLQFITRMRNSEKNRRDTAKGELKNWKNPQRILQKLNLHLKNQNMKETLGQLQKARESFRRKYN